MTDRLKDRFIELTDLGKSYDTPDGQAVIVRDFNLKVRESEFICIIGHSGCGKSTVLSILMGLSDASVGTVIVAGREVDGPGLDRGVVFQSSALLPWLTVRENVDLAVDQANSRMPRAERIQLSEAHLAAVGLEGLGDQYPEELSAGMRQRVGIARAFALEPKVLLLDEPFSLLDAMTRMELQDELKRLWEKDKRTVIMVTHDVDEALLLADRIVMMTGGPAATIGQILEVPLPHPRVRADLMDDPAYYVARDQLLSFLDGPSGHGGGPASTPEETPEEAPVTAVSGWRSWFRPAAFKVTSPPPASAPAFASGLCPPAPDEN